MLINSVFSAYIHKTSKRMVFIRCADLFTLFFIPLFKQQSGAWSICTFQRNDFLTFFIETVIRHLILHAVGM